MRAVSGYRAWNIIKRMKKSSKLLRTKRNKKESSSKLSRMETFQKEIEKFQVIAHET